MPNSKQVTPDPVEEERDSSRPSNSNNNLEHEAGTFLIYFMISLIMDPLIYIYGECYQHFKA